MTPEQSFGIVLRLLRREHGLSQEKLAMEAGIERNYVSLLELGRNSVSLKILFKLSDVLDIEPSEFLRRVQSQLREQRKNRLE